MLNRAIDSLHDKYLAPEWSHSALVTIDTQRDFSLDGAVAQIPGTMEVIPSMRALLHEFRNCGLPIFHVVRLYKTDGSNVDICRKSAIESGFSMASPDTEGAELVSDLLPHPDIKLDSETLLNGFLQEIASREWIIYKPRFGAFYQTNFQMHLESLKINTLVFCGCNFPNCPRTSIYEASERDYRIVLARDSISGLYDKGIEEMCNIGVSVIFSQDIIGNLKTRYVK